MDFGISDIIISIIAFLVVVISRYMRTFYQSQNNITQRSGFLEALDLLSDFAVHEVERRTKQKETDIKGNDKKQEAARILLELLEETLGKKDIKKRQLTTDSKLIQGAIERKAQQLPQPIRPQAL